MVPYISVSGFVVSTTGRRGRREITEASCVPIAREFITKYPNERIQKELGNPHIGGSLAACEADCKSCSRMPPWRCKNAQLEKGFWKDLQSLSPGLRNIALYGSIAMNRAEVGWQARRPVNEIPLELPKV